MAEREGFVTGDRAQDLDQSFCKFRVAGLLFSEMAIGTLRVKSDFNMSAEGSSSVVGDQKSSKRAWLSALGSSMGVPESGYWSKY